MQSLPPQLSQGPNSGAPLFRLLIVALLFALNFFALVGVLFRGQSSSSVLVKNGKNYNKLCAHRFSYGLLCLLLNAYLGTWIPYLFSSFLHSTVWPLLEIRTHCAIQHLATTQISTALLAILCLQKIFETFASRRAKLLCATIFFTWIFPQSLYTVISELISGSEVNDNGDSLYFLDAGSEEQLQQLQQKALTLQGTLSSPSSAFDHHHHQQIFSEGVLFCLHRLNYTVISSMTWHYVVLVVPLTSVFIICAGLKQFAKNSLFGSLPHVNCRCSGDIVTTFVLASNFIWLLFARPLLTLIALLQNDSFDKDSTSTENLTTESLPLDLCAHLLLFVLSAVLPFSAQFGLFACCSREKSPLDITEVDIESTSKPTVFKQSSNNIVSPKSNCNFAHSRPSF